MKKKIIITLCAIFGCLALAAIGAYGWHRSLIASFPMWREVEEPPEAEYPLASVEVLDVKAKAGAGMAWDELRVSLAMPERTAAEFYDNDPYFIDYKAWDGWHNIWKGENMRASVNSEPEEVMLRLPSGLFRAIGEYRVRFTWEKLREDGFVTAGSCQFRVQSPTRKAKGKMDNDFPLWQYAEPQNERQEEIYRYYLDRLPEDLELSFKGIIEQDGEDPVVELGVAPKVNRYNNYPQRDYGIEYLYDGEWYRVLNHFDTTFLGHEPVWVEPGEEGVFRAKVLPELLEHPGTYRVALYEAGYCQFQVEDGAARAE